MGSSLLRAIWEYLNSVDTSMIYLLRSGLSLFTHRKRHDFPVLGSNPLVLMELQSRAPNCRTYSTRISSSSGIHGPFLNTSSPVCTDLRLILFDPEPPCTPKFSCATYLLNELTYVKSLIPTETLIRSRVDRFEALSITKLISLQVWRKIPVLQRCPSWCNTITP